MVSDVIDRNDRFRGILDRLATKSIDDYYNPYRLFEWPESLPENMWWMSPELTTTHDSDVAATLSEQQLFALSRFESVNFYSLNVHGIRPGETGENHDDRLLTARFYGAEFVDE